MTVGVDDCLLLFKGEIHSFIHLFLTEMTKGMNQRKIRVSKITFFEQFIVLEFDLRKVNHQKFSKNSQFSFFFSAPEVVRDKDEK